MFRKVVAHLSIVLAGMCFVLFVIDAIKGGSMSFMHNGMTKAIVAAISLLTIFNTLPSIYTFARFVKANEERKPVHRRPIPNRSDSRGHNATSSVRRPGRSTNRFSSPVNNSRR